MSGKELPTVDLIGVTAEQCDAATRHVLRRFEVGALDADAARETLEMLGLIETHSAGRYDPVGRRLNPRST